MTGIKGKEKQLVEALRECQDVRSTCPTQEYPKLDTLELDQSVGKINLRLRARKGLEFDETEVQCSHEHTEERVKCQT